MVPPACSGSWHTPCSMPSGTEPVPRGSRSPRGLFTSRLKRLSPAAPLPQLFQPFSPSSPLTSPPRPRGAAEGPQRPGGLSSGGGVPPLPPVHPPCCPRSFPCPRRCGVPAPPHAHAGTRSGSTPADFPVGRSRGQPRDAASPGSAGQAGSGHPEPPCPCPAPVPPAHLQRGSATPGRQDPPAFHPKTMIIP